MPPDAPRGDGPGGSPWLPFLAGAGAIVLVVFGAFEVLQATALRDASTGDLAVGMAARGVVSSMLVAALALVIMARRLGRAEGRTRLAEAAEAKFRGLLESAPDAVLVLDGAGRILIVNSRAEALFGHRRQDLVGLRAQNLLAARHREGPDGGTDLFSPARARKGEPAELTCRRRDGTEFPAELTLSSAASGGDVLVTAVFRDLTERRRTEEERLRSMDRLRELERLKELDRFKTQFINMAAHELGTPLTPIRLQVELLKSGRAGELSEPQLRAMGILDRNVDRLAQLVQDVLEVARLQSGRLNAQREPVDLNRLVLEAVESFQEPARAAGLVIESRLSPGLRVEADPKRLTQVLFNLLGNAVKFTPGGGTVTVETRREAAGAVVRVRDTGIGIRAEDIPRLFQPFTQVHDPYAGVRGGTGLGLHISKGLVALHGGRIWCESEGLGRGATFAFAIPTEVAGPEGEAVAVERRDPRRREDEDAVARRAEELV